MRFGCRTLECMAPRKVRIRVGERTVTGRLVPGGEARPGLDNRGLLLAHGAGTNQDHPRVVELRDGLARAGLSVLTFNYPYSEAGRKSPDAQPLLLSTHRAARDFLGGEEVAGGAVGAEQQWLGVGALAVCLRIGVIECQHR